MQGKKPFLDKEVTRFRLLERIPPHNRYRRFAELIDWTFLHEETRGLYSHTGQPSLDPVVFSKHVLVGRLENLVSDGFFITTGRKTTLSPKLLFVSAFCERIDIILGVSLSSPYYEKASWPRQTPNAPSSIRKKGRLYATTAPLGALRMGYWPMRRLT